jgi:hypothetical protein
MKAPVATSPVSLHFDLQMAERHENIRVSASNLFKDFATQNGFVLQVPLSLDVNRWTIVVFDIYNLLQMSNLLPATYTIHGSYKIKSLTMCSHSVVRGIYTSDNLYDYVTMPADFRFKCSFALDQWF